MWFDTGFSGGLVLTHRINVAKEWVKHKAKSNHPKNQIDMWLDTGLNSGLVLAHKKKGGQIVGVIGGYI